MFNNAVQYNDTDDGDYNIYFNRISRAHNDLFININLIKILVVIKLILFNN